MVSRGLLQDRMREGVLVFLWLLPLLFHSPRTWQTNKVFGFAIDQFSLNLKGFLYFSKINKVAALSSFFFLTKQSEIKFVLLFFFQKTKMGRYPNLATLLEIEPIIPGFDFIQGLDLKASF